jgi:hypothetical protein
MHGNQVSVMSSCDLHSLSSQLCYHLLVPFRVQFDNVVDTVLVVAELGILWQPIGIMKNFPDLVESGCLISS